MKHLLAEFSLMALMFAAIPLACASHGTTVPTCVSEARRLVPGPAEPMFFVDGGAFLCNGLTCGLFSSVNLYDLQHKKTIEAKGGEFQGVCSLELPTGRSVFMEIYTISLGRLQ